MAWWSEGPSNCRPRLWVAVNNALVALISSLVIVHICVSVFTHSPHFNWGQ